MPIASELRGFRILSLDGGGAKGLYTLGVLKELEASYGPLHEHFNLIFGTSTGSIIGTLLAVGKNVDSILNLYRKYVPAIMKLKSPSEKSEKLAKVAEEIFGNLGFESVKTGLGIVATKWIQETPMIFKSEAIQAHGRKSTFIPGFGVNLGDAVQASCSAYPYFKKKEISFPDGSRVLLFDGGFCANNPALYAIADAVEAYKVPKSEIRLLSVGVGDYPLPKPTTFSFANLLRFIPGADIAQKTFNVNTQSMEQLRNILFSDVKAARISEAFTVPEMATDMFEYNESKLELIHQRGRESFGRQEADIHRLFN